MNIFSKLFEIGVRQTLEIRRLKKALEKYGLREVDYSFIPPGWKPIKDSSLVTKRKYIEYETAIPQALTDLLDSSHTSRREATRWLNKDENYLDIINYYIKKITYKTNRAQFGVMDLWTNGDISILSGQGDCDLSVRIAIRVIKDVIYLNKWEIHPAHVFQCYGYYHQTETKKVGHSWLMIYSERDNKFKIYEMTKNIPYSRGTYEKPDKYEMYFCHNHRRGYCQKNIWKIFL